MTEINWGLLADFDLYDAPELERRQKIRDALAARDRAQREQAQPDAAVAARRRIAREHGHDATTLHSCRECLAKIEAWDARQAVSTPTPATAVSTPTTPRRDDATPAVRTLGTPAAPQPTPTVQRAPDPVDELSAALAATPDDAARARLLAAAPRRVREAFNAAMIYRQLSRDATPDPHGEFSQALDAAPDDATRTALFAARSPVFLAEWARWQGATDDIIARRYLALIGGSDAGDDAE